MQSLISKAVQVSFPYSKRLYFNTRIGLYSRCDRQSKCSCVVRDILSDIRQHIDLYKGHVDRCTFSQCFRDFNIFKLLDEQCDPLCKYLTIHNCNVLALACVDEAILQLMEDTMDVSENKQNMISVLDACSCCLASSPFSSHTHSTSLDSSLAIYKLKFMGKGMKYLEQISKRNQLHKQSLY